MNKYLSLIKFSHTIFALPFALLGFFLAYVETGQSIVSWQLLVWVILAMVFARSAAMGFNRYLDRDIDAKNERTAVREIPAGKISKRSALAFVIASSVLFIGVTWFINPLCFALSPVALLVILGYSYTKRFTWACHLVLGLGLGLAPIGAYLAGGGGFDLIPIAYSFVVMFWVAGFDIIYALQDEDFDRFLSLHSIPAAFGSKRALEISSALHIASAVIIVIAASMLQLWYTPFGAITYIATAIYIILLYYQHTLVKVDDLSKVNLAFFTLNGFASLIFCGLVILDIFI